jgi:hypothetical protein
MHALRRAFAFAFMFRVLRVSMSMPAFPHFSDFVKTPLVVMGMSGGAARALAEPDISAPALRMAVVVPMVMRMTPFSRRGGIATPPVFFVIFVHFFIFNSFNGGFPIPILFSENPRSYRRSNPQTGKSCRCAI